MHLKGSFYMTGFDKSNRYLWQYKSYKKDNSSYLQHVIRPLFKTKDVIFKDSIILKIPFLIVPCCP